MSEPLADPPAPNEVIQHGTEAAVGLLLQSWAISGDPVYIVEAIRECGRYGVPLPTALVRALPILAKSLRRPQNAPTRQSLEILRQVAAINTARAAIIARAPYGPAANGPEPTSNEALRRIADQHGISLDAVKKVLQRWRKLHPAE